MDRATWSEFLLLGFHKQTEENPNLGLGQAWKEAVGNALTDLYGSTKKIPKYVEFAQKFVENAHGMEDTEGIGQIEGLGIFPRVSLLNHSCSPTCCLSRQGDTISVRTLKDFEPGEEFTITYIDLYISTNERQLQLQDRRYFTCSCSRCLTDDKNSLLKGILCPKCNKNYKFPYISTQNQDFDGTIPKSIIQYDDELKQWKCVTCNHIQTEDERKKVDRTIEETKISCTQVTELWSRRFYSGSYDKLSELFTNCQGILHPFHEILFNIYPVAMNYCRFSQDWGKAIKWCKVIISIMERSNAFPSLYPEVSNFYFCLGELYQKYNQKRKELTKSNKNFFLNECKDAFNRSYSIRKLCYGPYHPSTLSSEVLKTNPLRENK